MRPDPSELKPGLLVDRYELLLPIAIGGMAQIWAARLRGTRGFEKLVALKALAVSGAEAREAERLFWQEARVASQIQHPNVAQCFDLIEHEGVPCLTMEWIDGESLSALLREAARVGGVPLDIALQIMVQACKGLHAAHELRDARGQRLDLVHCDVSPANLMITTSGIVKLVDFGIAKLLRSSGHPERLVGGKPSFMAPEQARGEPVDRRADIFALGIILYLLTTGRHPFAAKNQAETLLAICSGRPVVPPGQLLPNYPPALEWVVMTALAHERAQRFQSVAELLEELLAACPNVASEAELARFMGLLCEVSLTNRRAKVSDALLRDIAPLAPREEVEEEGEEATPSSLSPALLSMGAEPSPRANRARPWYLGLAAGALLFMGVGWWLGSAAGPRERPAASGAPQADPVAAPRSLPVAAPAGAGTSPASPTEVDAPTVPKSDAPTAPPPKKRKRSSIGQRYGI